MEDTTSILPSHPGPLKTTTRYAVVDDKGNLQPGGVGAVNAERTSKGRFTIKFNDNVSGGCFTATLVRVESGQKGMITVTPPHGATPDTVLVQIFDKDGASQNLDFCLNATTVSNTMT